MIQHHFDVCTECFEYGNKVKIRQHCVDCGQQFDISNNQYDFYTSKGFDIPKRCKSCRDAKKNRSYSSSGGYSSQTTRHDTSSHNNDSSGSNGSFCFISTAICEYFGKSDDCVELNTLRSYRDNWLRNQLEGQQLIAEYYNNAPLIVSKLKTSAEYETYCQNLWDNYLQPCLKLIEDKQFELCKIRYIEMYQFLQSALS